MVKNRTKFTVFAILGVALMSACGSNNNTSTLQHDNNRPVRDAANWNWKEVSESDQETIVLAGAAPRGFVPSNSNLVKRSQYWVDRIDASLRANHAAEMAGVPKPKVKLLKVPEFNAFIAGSYSCFNLPLEISGRSGSRDSGLYIDLSAGGELTRWNDDDPSFPEKCINEPDRATLVTALAQFNATSSSCKFDVTDTKVVASADCALAADMEDAGGIAAGGKIVIGRTSSWVNIYTGLIEQLPNEEQFVSVISHELGHYYRSHMTSKPSEYGYYYILSDRNPDHKPEARSDLKEFGDEVYQSAEIVNIDPSFAKIDGQQISAKVYLAAGDLARQVCAAGGCTSSCKAVADLVNDSGYKRNNRIYPFGAGAITASIYLSKFEDNAKACLSGLQYGVNSTITPAMISEAIVQPVWFGAADNQDYYPANVKGAIRDILANVAKRSAALPTATTALELVQALGKKLDAQLPRAIELMAQARDQKLGQYTQEQEADELAVEWTTTIGLPPESMVHTNMTMAGMSAEDEMGGLIFGGETCTKLFENNWQDAAGNPVFVPVGDYSEIHHSACFRAFNTQRELLAHSYVQQSGNRPTPPGGAWDLIKTEATRVNRRLRQLERSPRANHVTETHTFAKKDQARLDSCVFSHGLAN
jgi:hypothetical protein